MTYVPAEDRYEPHGLPPLRPLRPACCRRSRSASGTTSARTPRTRPSAPSCRTAFDAGITHFDLANNYGPPPGSAETAFGEILRTDLARLPRRADRLVQGRLPDVARPLRRVGQPQVPARLLRPEPEAHGPRLRRHLLLAPLRPRHAARGDDGRARRHRPLRPRALRRHLLLQLRADPRGGGDPRRPRHPLRDPPAELQHDQPLGGARRPEGHARRSSASARSPSPRSPRAC